MRRRVLFLCAPIVVFAVVADACTAAPSDSIPEPTAGACSALVPGPCADACAAIQSGACDWQSQCSEDWGGSGMGALVTLCGQKFIDCEAAEKAAANPGAFGMEYCFRSCMGLH